MNYKVKTLIEKYRAILSGWDGVECITLNEAALPDIFDPYFALILDVFYAGKIPGADERAAQYGAEALVFETTGSKDRFLDGDVPVRFEFKKMAAINELVNIAARHTESLYLIKDAGTYGFYRLNEGEILFSRSDWILSLRKKLDGFTNDFWDTMRFACQSKMEHFLSDLGAALIQEDSFFYLISASGFIKTACLALFCINRCFEPSHRQYYEKALALPLLPESFRAQLEIFLRSDTTITMERRHATAQLIARGILAL